jgi:hypothetical protein
VTDFNYDGQKLKFGPIFFRLLSVFIRDQQDPEYHRILSIHLNLPHRQVIHFCFQVGFLLISATIKICVVIEPYPTTSKDYLKKAGE